LQHVVDCYTSYFNEHRPHQGIANEIPAEYNKSNGPRGSHKSNLNAGHIICEGFLGGFLKSYRKAA
jgi:hypothetical protein